MASLVFASDPNPNNSHEIKLDTSDVLAVVDLGFQKHSGEIFAHRRAVYFKDGTGENGDIKIGLKTVWEKSKAERVPSSIAQLDVLGGKSFISFAKTASYNSSELASANSVKVSTAAADMELIVETSFKKSTLIKTGVSAAFTKSGEIATIPEGTTMHYATLNLGDTQSIPVAHLDGNRFGVFPALAKA